MSFPLQPKAHVSKHVISKHKIKTHARQSVANDKEIEKSENMLPAAARRTRLQELHPVETNNKREKSAPAAPLFSRSRRLQMPRKIPRESKIYMPKHKQTPTPPNLYTV